MSNLGVLAGIWRDRPLDERAQADFDNFVAASVDGLLRTAYLVVWNAADAEDLVQECLMQVARRWSRVRSMEQPLAYARRILVNLALDDRRARSREQRQSLDTPDALEARADETSGAAFGEVEARLELEAALATLPVRQRAVLVLRYFDDLTEAQVAQALGCSVGTVKSSASRGLERLRVAMAIPALEISSGPGTARAVQGAMSDG